MRTVLEVESDQVTSVRRSEAQRSMAQRSMEEKGYFVFRDVLSPEEISRLRTAVREHFKATGRPDIHGGWRQANIAVEIPSIGWVFHHPKILSCVRDAFGTDQIMFTSDSTAYKDVLINWHKDDKQYFENRTDQECAVYKANIYLYDHDRDGSGFWVREGSHKSPYDVGPIRDTAVSAGSIVVFDVRLTHRGLAKSAWQRLILRMSAFLPLSLQRCVDVAFAKTRMLYRTMLGRERILLTISFGLPNDYTIDFAKRSMRRQLSNTPGTSPTLPPSLRREFEDHGVLLAEDHFIGL
jgi:hypothetical protein